MTPGKELNFTDNEPVNGFNDYMFIAYNGKGRGDDINKKAYIGVDFPAAVMNVNAKEVADGIIKITWEAQTKGINGGYIDPSKLKYLVRRNASFLVGNGPLTELSVNDTIEGLGDKQLIYGYAINAHSEAEIGADAFSPCVMEGKPYELPVVESFSNGMLTYTDWTTFPMLSGSKWDPVQDNDNRAQDGDHGMLSLISPMVSTGPLTLMSPKFRMNNTVKPVLEFWVFHSSNEGTMTLELLNPEQQFEKVLDIDFGQDVGKWNKYTVDLSEYVNEKTLQFIFTTSNFSKGDALYIDNVNVYDNLEHNIAAVGLEAPLKLEVGETGDFIVKVRNLGKQTAKNYTINIYNGDEIKKTISGPSLSAGETKDVSVKIIPQTTDLYDMKLHAVVQYDADENLNNNTTNVVNVKVVPLSYPAITDLKGNKEDNRVNLTWTAPDLTNMKPEYTVEDFEKYEAFTITDLGDWTMLDKDNNAASMEFRTADNQWIIYPNGGGKMNFQVIDLSQIIGTKKDGWTSMSGNKILISPYSSGVNGNDDWLISPELYSLGQTITLNAKSLNFDNYGLEHFQVLYSTTDKNSDSFVELATEENVPMEWTEYSYTLPKDAKFFAIRAYMVNSALFLDDIKFIPVSAKPVELEMMGYNVYRNGKKLNDTPVAETSYADNDISYDETYRYRVTVAYDKGESDYSNEYVAGSVSGISDTETDMPVLFAENGSIRIDNTSGKTVEVYTVNGTLVVCEKNKKKLSINVPRGIYIVKVGSETYKVVVD
ncbi:T9SS-dependent choice-of-anchor J family protein [Prevotella sp. OH937_COT-195]|uniref:T9SS-dependent choice-of-anchor J family protein n=1 Tax=Prevotella sp. OH937_COT-195 TaxID=2491051 RepID=UPI000F651574|nr:choice-of-anchor J domain-containing protein [Prevotella sp. OH937_COT-195]RRC99447.1 T9SS C-terminal target domain-containing protein [Prevotella sp. OH937_COT-195]